MCSILSQNVPLLFAGHFNRKRRQKTSFSPKSKLMPEDLIRTETNDPFGLVQDREGHPSSLFTSPRNNKFRPASISIFGPHFPWWIRFLKTCVVAAETRHSQSGSSTNWSPHISFRMVIIFLVLPLALVFAGQIRRSGKAKFHLGNIILVVYWILRNAPSWFLFYSIMAQNQATTFVPDDQNC